MAPLSCMVDTRGSCHAGRPAGGCHALWRLVARPPQAAVRRVGRRHAMFVGSYTSSAE